MAPAFSLIAATSTAAASDASAISDFFFTAKEGRENARDFVGVKSGQRSQSSFHVDLAGSRPAQLLLRHCRRSCRPTRPTQRLVTPLRLELMFLLLMRRRLLLLLMKMMMMMMLLSAGFDYESFFIGRLVRRLGD